ncbi:hypothetical protein ACFPVX_17980 [Cohnella faecalis]|uniref:Uncharacterized protein n=1 Tax=Cohnella faecalis TaxID=2315694 RepID=A0A398CH57_9BACL|nr:hypothetical protein [Cohnella faecalis]RIE01302.1 hypothetical protein D3H35_23245 [Cohnella faecalis]
MSHHNEQDTPVSNNSLEPTYSKRQLLEAGRFTPLQKDVLSAVLTNYELYSVDKAERMISDFEQGTVK